MAIEKSEKGTWFKGLNALRFFAASMVVLMHTQSNQKISGIVHFPDFPIFYKGLWAVSFFFVLSGFLITYLLLKEKSSTQTIDVKDFYLRRVFRIWPLYFSVVIFGLLFYWKLAPIVGLESKNSYSLTSAIFLFVFFLANLGNHIFDVGGILHVTWSIAVEEQFYLFWAPIAKYFHSKIVQISIFITLFFLIINALNIINFFHLSEHYQLFVRTFQFYYMGIGALLAWTLYYKKEKLLAQVVFTSKPVQWLLTVLIVLFFVGYEKSTWGEIILPLPVGLLLGWLIVNMAANPNRIFNLDNKILNYLGDISYGVYMLHVPLVYALSFVFKIYLTGLNQSYSGLFLYYALLFGSVIIAASISYRFFEQPILKIHKQLKKH